MAALHKKRLNDESFFDQSRMDAVSREHLASVKAELQVDGHVLGVGLWQDGVATKWDRNSSIEMLTLHLPGLGGRWKNMRIPLFAIDKSWVVKPKTWDAVFQVVFQVVVWSLRSLALGCGRRPATTGRTGTPQTAAAASRLAPHSASGALSAR